MASTKVLIAGGRGYIGSALLSPLLDAGRSVSEVDTCRHGVKPLAAVRVNARLSVIRGDCCDAKSKAAAAKDADIPTTVAATFINVIENLAWMRGQAYKVGISSSNYSRLESAKRVKNYAPDFTYIEAPIGGNLDKRDCVTCDEKPEAMGCAAPLLVQRCDPGAH